MTKRRRVLLISLSNLGDIVLTTPVLGRLIEVYKDAEIDVAVGPAGREIFSKIDRVNVVIVMEKHRSFGNRLKYFFRILTGKYDLIVDLKRLSPPKSVNELHKKDEHLLKLKKYGITEGPGDLIIPVQEEDVQYAESIVRKAEGPVVVISPGSKSHLKRWNVKKYAELADRLVEYKKCKILIIGNNDDKDVVLEMMEEVKYPVTDLSGKTSVSSLVALMKRASVVITNDSAPLHIASAANAPTVAIFGPSNEKKYGPLADKSKVIKPRVTCRPCETALCALGPEEGCISQITVDEVFRAVKELILSLDEFL